MSEPSPNQDGDPPATDAEEERLRKWREERARVAEEQRRERLAQAEIDKQSRIAEAKEARDRQADAEMSARREEARQLLPTPEGLAAARARLANLARRRTRWLVAQLLVFVLAPTLLVTAYLAKVATPLYEARSVVVVTKPSSDQGGDLGAVLPGLSGGVRLNEAFQAYEYIRSQALMDQLEAEAGVVTRFSGNEIDPLRRLRDVPLLGVTKHFLFDTYVSASIDIQTGLIKLNVRAPSAALSVDLSERVIDITAAQINRLADQLFAESVTQSEAAVTAARDQLRAAQSAMTQLQIDSGEIDPRARIEGIFAAIDKLTLDAQTLRAEIEDSEVAGIGDTNQTDRLRKREELLNERIKAERARLVGAGLASEPSLNALLLAHELAALDIRIAEETLTTALHAAEQARKEAALGRNFFQVVVPPAPSDHPTHPNIPRAALLTLLVLLGLFSVSKLMLFRR